MLSRGAPPGPDHFGSDYDLKLSGTVIIGRASPRIGSEACSNRHLRQVEKRFGARRERANFFGWGRGGVRDGSPDISPLCVPTR